MIEHVRAAINAIRGPLDEGSDTEPKLRPSVFLIVLGLPLVFLVGTVLAHVLEGVPFGDITREPSATLGGAPLIGIQSNLGVLLWWTGGTACLFACSILRTKSRRASSPGFFLWAGLITILLAFDDLLQLHEEVYYEYLGLSERRTLVVYGAVLAIFLWHFRRSILSSRSLPLLVLALVLLGSSAAIDVTTRFWSDPEMRILFEDGLKLLGIMSWTAYLVRRSYYAVAGAGSVSNSESEPPHDSGAR